MRVKATEIDALLHAADQRDVALNHLQTVFDAMMHLLHQDPVLRERRLQRALPLARVLGHGVDRLRHASELRPASLD